MELALLREENARLKVERHRPADVGRVIERMRHIGAEPVADGRGDESSASEPAGRAMDDCLEMRDGLIAACQEVQQAMQGIRSRLGALSVDFQEELGDRASRRPSSVAGAEEINVELTADARVSSGFAQTAA